jgi:hypothetical protein
MSYPHSIIWHRIGSAAAVDPRDRQSGPVELDKLQALTAMAELIYRDDSEPYPHLS